MELQKFKKKPIVISAEQYKKCQSPVSADACFEIHGDLRFVGHPHVHTLEGTSYDLSDGDWIITGIKGEKYPCKPDVFAATYEPYDPNSEPREAFWTDSKGVEHVVEEVALAQLLQDDVLFCNERETVENEYKVVDGKLYNDDSKPIHRGESTTILFVLCNDLFYWASADAERLPNSEIGRLYKMHMADKKHGSSKWCCLRRGLRPQVPIVEMMKADGAWDVALEMLPAPEPS